MAALARNPFDRFVAWLQPDPRDPYLREPGRRLDRVDLAVVVGLVLFAFLFRLWRLDTPRSMHFDEVYHARSATEWLTDWQEGWTRDTYEWTHPMLAKYLIAAGIVVADPNKVVARDRYRRCRTTPWRWRRSARRRAWSTRSSSAPATAGPSPPAR